MNETTQTEATAIATITVQQRAVIAIGYGDKESYLVELASKSKSITAITNKAGHQECHAARMVLRNERVAISRMGKQAREDATAFSKAVVAEEKRLIDLISDEEQRLEAIQNAWEAAEKAAKEAAAEAERRRVAEIIDRITRIKDMPATCAFQKPGELRITIDTLSQVEIDDSYAEFYGQAVEARADAIAKMREILAAAERAEAEAAHIKAEQEVEAERLKVEREEQARLDAIEREKLAAERAELDRQRAEQQAAKEVADRIVAEKFAAQQATLQAEREKLEKEQAELKRQQAEIQAEKDAETARIAAERAEADRIAAEERSREAVRIAAEKAEADQLAKAALEREAEAIARIQAHATELLDALKALVEFTDERIGDNECRPLENAKRAIANAENAN